MKSNSVAAFLFSVLLTVSLIHSARAQVPASCENFNIDQKAKDLSLSELREIDHSLFFHYEQAHFSTSDSVGDVALQKLTSQTLKHVVWMTLNKKTKLSKATEMRNASKECAKWFFDIETQTEYLDHVENKTETKEMGNEGKLPPIRPKNLALAFVRIMQEEFKLSGIKPRYGEIHEFSSEYKRSKQVSLDPFQMGSKILLCLSKGITGRFLKTGKEEKLNQWILEQSESSITLTEMFRKSYQLHSGNVYLTLLGIENVLSKNWANPNRAELKLTKNLAKIINHFGEGEDRFGSWYHLFGMVLYGYVNTATQAYIIGEIEALGSQIMGGFEKEKQENSINRRTGNTGAKIRQAVLKNTWLETSTDPSFLKESFYLQYEKDPVQYIELDENHFLSD